MRARLSSRPVHRGWLGILAAVVCLGLCGGPAPAQDAPPADDPFGPASARPDLEVYEGRLIRRIDLVRVNMADEPAGQLTDQDRQLIRNQLRAVEGTSYRQETVTGDIVRLNRLGRFARVASKVQLLEDGSVILSYRVQEQPIITDIQAVGNNQLSDQEIADALNILVGTPVDRLQIDRAARRIEALYRERGYYLARVGIDEQELEETGIVLFRIREGNRLKVVDIRFEGNAAFSDRELRTQVGTKEAWLLDRGPLDNDTLEEDVASIAAWYRDRGYLDVRVDREIRVSPNNREAIVTFLVEEGPIYTLREVRVLWNPEGSDAMSAEQIRGLMTIKAGDVYGIRAVDESVESVERALGKLGFVQVRVRAERLRDEIRPLVDMVLIIAPGERSTTGLVTITGNTLTKDKVIRRNIYVQPDRPLDTTEVEKAEQRISQTRLFAPGSVKVTVQPENPAEPGYRDVLVEVEETNTGSFNIGAAVDSDAGVTGLISLEQRNFDLADVPETPGELISGRAFRGAGQTFTLSAQPGTRVQLYSVQFSEPRLLDSNYSLGAALNYRDRDFDEFDEIRYGGRFSLGRRFGTRWTGNLTLRVEEIDLRDVEADSPTDVFAFKGRNTLVGVGANASRNSLDHPILPTRGSSLRLGVEQVGPAGDINFTELTADYNLYIGLYEDYLGRKTVLSTQTRVSYIPQDQSEVPVYERFYLGGNSFRGFEFRTISPRGVRNDNGQPSSDPIGGTWLFFHNWELSFPLYSEFIRGVTFIDTGTVTFDPGFEDYRVSVGVGLRLVVPQLSPAPIALDFGFPIKKEPTDENRVFSFSVDLPF